MGPAEVVGAARSLVDVAAEEVDGLLAFDEFPDGGAAEMHASCGFVELRVARRAVDDQHQWFVVVEMRQPLGEFFLGVFAGRVEGRRVGVAQTGDRVAVKGERLAVEIVQAILLAIGGTLCRAPSYLVPEGP